MTSDGQRPDRGKSGWVGANSSSYNTNPAVDLPRVGASPREANAAATDGLCADQKSPDRVQNDMHSMSKQVEVLT